MLLLSLLLFVFGITRLRHRDRSLSGLKEKMKKLFLTLPGELHVSRIIQSHRNNHYNHSRKVKDYPNAKDDHIDGDSLL